MIVIPSDLHRLTASVTQPEMLKLAALNRYCRSARRVSLLALQ